MKTTTAIGKTGERIRGMAAAPCYGDDDIACECHAGDRAEALYDDGGFRDADDEDAADATAWRAARGLALS